MSLLIPEILRAPLIIAQTVLQLRDWGTFTLQEIIGPMIGFVVLAHGVLAPVVIAPVWVPPAIVVGTLWFVTAPGALWQLTRLFRTPVPEGES